MNKFMQRAIKLGYSNLGRVSPNPSVGAVIVKDNKIIAEGVTQKPGGNHAEIEAIRKCEAKGAVLYVTLEPCCHTNKRTPPCVDKIIKSGIKRVVIGVKDPHPEVNGKGIEKLKKAGIEVVDLNLDEAKELHKFFFKWITGTPYITLKLALTADNKMTWGDGKNKKITGKEADKFVHELRNMHDAILVGVNTIIKDNPRLTYRMPNGRNPIRIILDSKLRIPMDAQVFKEEGRAIVVSTTANSEKFETLFAKEKDGKIDLKYMLIKLAKMGITSILVEGGVEVANAFTELADKVIIIKSSLRAGGKRVDFSEKHLNCTGGWKLGEDNLYAYERHNQ